MKNHRFIHARKMSAGRIAIYHSNQLRAGSCLRDSLTFSVLISNGLKCSLSASPSAWSGIPFSSIKSHCAAASTGRPTRSVQSVARFQRFTVADIIARQQRVHPFCDPLGELVTLSVLILKIHIEMPYMASPLSKKTEVFYLN